MAIKLDLTGQRYGMLVVIERSHLRSTDGKPQWRLRCDCGREAHLVAARFRSMGQQSCGCLMVAKGRNLKHGFSRSRTYRIWNGMHSRCTNPNQTGFEHYGGRGIKVCARWSSFENFLADMGVAPRGKTLDRYPNVNGNYEPGNCRWATGSEQCRNRRNTVYLTFRGETKPSSDWAAAVGLRPHVVIGRLRLGWSVERALTEPLHFRPTRKP